MLAMCAALEHEDEMVKLTMTTSAMSVNERAWTQFASSHARQQKRARALHSGDWRRSSLRPHGSIPSKKMLEVFRSKSPVRRFMRSGYRPIVPHTSPLRDHV